MQQDDLFSLFDEFKKKLNSPSQLGNSRNSHDESSKNTGSSPKQKPSSQDTPSLPEKTQPAIALVDKSAGFQSGNNESRNYSALPAQTAKKKKPLSVTELSNIIRDVIESNIPRVLVEGEISNWKRHSSGHCYFSLKDEQAIIQCVMFRKEAQSLKFEPRDGTKVMIEGHIGVYEKQGRYQLYAEFMQQSGVGDLYRRFLELRDKLEREGLFVTAHKKSLPFLPQTIAVVTSPTGAAIRDILNILNRRFANIRVYVYPVEVQGERASAQIAAAIRQLNLWKDILKIDVMIIGRGGGSIEDLWAFNEEVVARAVYDSQIPVISAVGHEVDFTISDFVADMRAPTPSAAAELVVHNQQELHDSLTALDGNLEKAMSYKVQILNEKIDRLCHHYAMRHPSIKLKEFLQRADELDERLRIYIKNNLQQHHQHVRRLEEQIRALGPEHVLERGYSIVKKIIDGSIVNDASVLTPDENLDIQFYRGMAEVKVHKLKN